MVTEETASRREKSQEAPVLDVADEAAVGAGVSGAGNGTSRRKMESRRKLLAAARKLFVERGYHDTRPQDISREAGVGHGTFYLHFEDKLDCFLAFTEEAANELDVFVSQYLASAGALDEVIREILRAIFEYSDERPGVLAAALTDVTVFSTGDLSRKMPAARWAQGWTRLLDELQSKGAVAGDIDTRLAGYLIIGAIKQGGAFATRDHIDRDIFIDNMTKLFVRALRTQ